MDPQTVDFYTADLYLNLLSDHNVNFSKYMKKIVTDYTFEVSLVCLQNTKQGKRRDVEINDTLLMQLLFPLSYSRARILFDG